MQVTYISLVSVATEPFEGCSVLSPTIFELQLPSSYELLFVHLNIQFNIVLYLMAHFFFAILTLLALLILLFT